MKNIAKKWSAGIGILIFGLSILSSCSAQMAARKNQKEIQSPETLAVFPLANLTGNREAVEKIYPALLPALKQKGFHIFDHESMEIFLQDRRIRYTDSLSADDTVQLREELGIKYLLFGSVFSYAKEDIPDVGLSVRIIDTATNLMVWGGAVSRTGEDQPGLFNRKRIVSQEEMTHQVVTELFSSLTMRVEEGSVKVTGERRGGKNRILSPNPHYYRKKKMEMKDYQTIAIIPFSNRTQNQHAGRIVHDHFVINLSSSADVIVIEPAELRRVLIRARVRNAAFLTQDILGILRSELGIKAVIYGTVYRWEEEAYGVNGVEPQVELSAKMIDTSSGDTVWSALQKRDGNDSISAYEFGKVRSTGSLTGEAVANMLSTLIK